jgi:hypothetical protein
MGSNMKIRAIKNFKQFNEDIFYEPKSIIHNWEEEIEKIVKKTLDILDPEEDSRYCLIRSNGTDIEVGEVIKNSSKISDNNKKLMKEEWEEQANNVINTLEENGFIGYEIALIGYGGFRC